MSNRLLQATVCVGIALLAACSGQDAAGPLGNGGDGGQQCALGGEGQPITIGIYALENKGTSPVTVKSVSLPSLRGLKMTRAWVTPIYHLTLIGAPGAYPPTTGHFAAETGPPWAKRKPAAGAVIRPGQSLNLVFGLTRTTSHAGYSAGPVIVYTADGTTYTMQENVSLRVTQKCF